MASAVSTALRDVGGTVRSTDLATLLISRADLDELLRRLGQKTAVYAPFRGGGALHFERFQVGRSGMVLGGARTVEPVKTFFFQSRSRLAAYFSPNGLKETQPPGVTLAGVKACDIHSLRVLDSVFCGGPFADPYYVTARAQTTLIATDCLSPGDSCFCTAVGLGPYLESGYDLNLSESSGGFLVDIGSAKGAAIVEENRDLFSQAAADAVEGRDAARAQAVRRLKEGDSALSSDTLSEWVKRAAGSPVWEEMARRCVGCAACEMVCPTCHCFFIYDQRNGDGFEKVRVWDSCHMAGFVRAAGGGNPRAVFAERFKTRFAHKFVFFPEVEGFYGCTGCGRCVDACLAGIDMRQVLAGLVVQRGPKEP